MDPWPIVDEDRRALAEYLSELSPGEWKKQSLCANWTVEEVAAHMLVIPTVSKGKIFINFLASGFNVDGFSAKMVSRITDENSPEELAEAMGETCACLSSSAAAHRCAPQRLAVPSDLLGTLVTEQS